MTSVVIFGGSGFIGTHLTRKCIEAGISVCVVDLVPTRFEHPLLTYIKGDVRDLKGLRLEGVDRIYNFAAIHTTPGHESHEYYETNVAGATEVCKFAEDSDIDEIVFTSSISVYGPDEELKDEHSKLTPNSAYGYSKMLAERIQRAWYGRKKGRKLIIVRPAVVFGPGEGGNFTRLATMLKKGFFVYPGRKDTIKSCIYVDDLLQIIDSARASENGFELLNGAYPERYTLENIVDELRNSYFPNARIIMVPKAIVIMMAKLLGLFNFLNIGIHPDRVMKLIRSTNVYPGWLERNSINMSGDLRSALKRWDVNSDGRFD